MSTITLTPDEHWKLDEILQAAYEKINEADQVIMDKVIGGTAITEKNQALSTKLLQLTQRLGEAAATVRHVQLEFRPQEEWLGGDSMDPRNFGYRSRITGEKWRPDNGNDQARPGRDQEASQGEDAGTRSGSSS